MSLDSGKIDLKVFIEGVEVPVHLVNTTEQIASITSAAISLPYSRTGKDILPRSLVHVFVYDESYANVRAAPVAEGSPADNIFKETSYPEGSKLKDYILHFWGETVSYQRADSAGETVLGLGCYGFANYLSTIQQLSALRGRGTFSDTERRFMGIENSISTGSSGRYSTADRITQLLREGGVGLQEGISALIKEFIEGTNAFYRNRSDVLRLSDMIKPIENDDSGETLMDLDLFRRFLRQSLGSTGMYTIGDMLKILAELLSHDWVEHAQPPHFPYVATGDLRSLGSSSLERDTQVVTRETQVDKVTAIIFKPELWWTCPPACNVIFPSQYSNISDNRVAIMEPTRTILKISPGVSGSRTTIADDYFAPDVMSLNNLAATTDVSDQEVFQLPHERFQGIRTNVIPLNEELARLTRRDGFQAYMRSTAQFRHWKAVYSTRSVTIGSQRLLNQVLVGYPAIAIDRNVVKRSEPEGDPHLEERMLLRRELAALRRCLRRLRALRRALVNRIDGLSTSMHYLMWIGNNRVAVIRGDVRRNLSNYADIVSWTLDQAISDERSQLNAATPVFNLTTASTVALPVPDENGAPRRTTVPEYDEAILREVCGDRAEWVILVYGNITLNMAHADSVRVILEMTQELFVAHREAEAQLVSLDSQISRVQRAIREVRDRLLDLGWDTGTYEHVLFYVNQKVSKISTEGISTSLVGTFARIHDEDIDLDGTRGDTFENIIKAGPGEFFSDIYSADLIGERFYYPTYGVRSLIDIAVDLQPIMAHENDALDDEITAEANGEIPYWRQVIRDICQRDFEGMSASEGMSIEDAVDVLVEVYRNLGMGTQDIEAFVSQFVSRPIATIVDILGADILQNDPQEYAYQYGNYQGSQALPGVGFHQFAFMAEDETFDMSGLEGRESDHLHVATARRQRVLDYVREVSSRDIAS